MSTGNFRLPLNQAQPLAEKIADDLRPVCERVEIAGSVRRQRADVGDLELVAIPKFSKSLLPDVPGVSLLDMHLVALCGQGRLQRATATPIEELLIKPFYIPALMRGGVFFKLEINVATEDNWPVLLAIKTGPAEFSHRLVAHSDNSIRGFLPRGWEIRDGWQVWQPNGDGMKRVWFESERDFIETFCGAWIPPEKR